MFFLLSLWVTFNLKISFHLFDSFHYVFLKDETHKKNKQKNKIKNHTTYWNKNRKSGIEPDEEQKDNIIYKINKYFCGQKRKYGFFSLNFSSRLLYRRQCNFLCTELSGARNLDFLCDHLRNFLYSFEDQVFNIIYRIVR